MKNKTALSLLTAVVLAGAYNNNSANAEDCKGSCKVKTWVGAGAHFFEGDDPAESGGLYEVRVGYDHNPRYTSEIGIGGSPFLEGNDYPAPSPKEATFNGRNSPGEGWMVKTDYSLQYHLNTNPEKKWDPYVSANAGWAYFGKRREGNNNAFFGGPGLGLTYWVSPKFALRGDYTMQVTEDSDVEINHEALILAHYKFGPRSSEQVGERASTENNELGARSSAQLKTIYFDYDKAKITKDSENRLKDNAEWIKNNPSSKVSLEGHCDERGTNEYNLALGARRANSTQKYLTNIGVAKSQLSTNSFGEELPVDPGHTEEAWKKNRRVESVVK